MATTWKSLSDEHSSIQNTPAKHCRGVLLSPYNHVMPRKRVIFTLIVFAISATLLLPALLPNPRMIEKVAFPTEFTLATGQAIAIEPRELVLDAPRRIKLGTSDDIILRLDLLPDGQTTDRESLAWSVAVEARLELPGLPLKPEAMLSEPYFPGEAMLFSWRLIPEQAGEFNGTLWIYAALLDTSTGIKEQQALYALPIEMIVTSVLGVRADLLKWIGLTGIFLAVVSILPLMFEGWLRKLMRDETSPAK